MTPTGGDQPGGSVPPHAGPPLVPGRICGTCSMCCKVYSINELNKPAGRWCIHSLPGRGCADHDNRPSSCRQFFCSWLVDPNLGPEWKPEVCHFVLSADAAFRALVVKVDPGRPFAWRQEPYYSVLRQYSEAFFRINQKVLVNVMGHITVILPENDVTIGRLGPGAQIDIWREGSSYGAGLRQVAAVHRA
jgi:hypothetical protein